MAAGFALFALLITLFVKIFPILAVWEMAKDMESAEIPSAAGRLASEPIGGGSP